MRKIMMAMFAILLFAVTSAKAEKVTVIKKVWGKGCHQAADEKGQKVVACEKSLVIWKDLGSPQDYQRGTPRYFTKKEIDDTCIFARGHLKCYSKHFTNIENENDNLNPDDFVTTITKTWGKGCHVKGKDRFSDITIACKKIRSFRKDTGMEDYEEDWPSSEMVVTQGYLNESCVFGNGSLKCYQRVTVPINGD